MARIKASEKVTSPDFSLDEIKHAVGELTSGRCMKPIGLVREVFKTACDGFLLTILEMVNFIKRSRGQKLALLNGVISGLKLKKERIIQEIF